jgi:hypothetical protein
MIDNLGYLVVVGFATFRLWRLFAVDNIFAGPRSRLPASVLSFVTCAWCFGFWLAVIVYLALREWGDIEWVQAVTIIFALSGLIGLLAHATGDE